MLSLLLVNQTNTVKLCYTFSSMCRYYKVVAPNTIRPNSEFHVAVSTPFTSQNTFVSISIVELSYAGRNFSIYDRLVVQPYATSLAKLEVNSSRISIIFR